FVLYLRRFFEPMAEISQFYDSFQGAAAALEKLSGVLEEEPSVPMPPPSAAASAPAGGWRGEVRFEAVRFGYARGANVLPDPGLPGGPRRAHPGRGDVLTGRADGARRAAGASNGAGRADRGDHRAPALHGGDRRPGAGDRRRADRGGRAAGRAAGRRRALRPP